MPAVEFGGNSENRDGERWVARLVSENEPSAIEVTSYIIPC